MQILCIIILYIHVDTLDINFYFVEKVELDGQLIELPEIEAIVILNISSWGGGCQPWGAGHEENKQLKPARYGKYVYVYGQSLRK